MLAGVGVDVGVDEVHIFVRQLYQYHSVFPEGQELLPCEQPEPSHPQSIFDVQLEQLEQNWQLEP